MSVQRLRRRRAPRGSGDQLREEILDATTELLLKTGEAKAVSIRAVSQLVGVTPPSIYLHFADKDALLEGVLDIARDIASKSPIAIAGTKEMISYMRDHRIDDGLEYLCNGA